MKTKNIIYVLIDPITEQIRYVGKSETGIDRLREHLKVSSLKTNNYKNNWINGLLEKGSKPEIYIVEYYLNPNDLFEAEEFWYEYYISIGCNLTNATKCGKGTRGYLHKDETKKKIGDKASIRLKGLPLPEGMHLPKEIIEVDNIKYKNCSGCKINKPIDNFGWVEAQHRFQSYCKDCNIKYQAEWKLKNPSPLLSDSDYNASRLPGAYAGGETSKSPERRKQTSELRSKAIIATHILTGEVLHFKSALEAKEKGFQNTNIGQAIKFNKPYREYRWKFK